MFFKVFFTNFFLPVATTKLELGAVKLLPILLILVSIVSRVNGPQQKEVATRRFVSIAVVANGAARRVLLHPKLVKRVQKIQSQI